MKFGGSVDGSVDGVGVGVGGCRGVAREGGGHVGSGSGEGDEQRLQEERAEVAGAARGARGSELSSVDLREEGVQVVRTASGGPRPPRVLKTMGKKARSWAMEPARCLLFFSAARAVKRAVASSAAAGAKVGINGQETVTSMAVTGG